MKKIAIFILALIFMLTTSGCSFHQSVKSIGMKTATELLKYIDAGDIEGIKNLLSKKTLALPDIENKIIEFTEHFEGDVIKYDDYISVGESKTIKKSKVVYSAYGADVDNIKTNANKNYQLLFSCKLVYAEDTNKEGICEIRLINKVTEEEFSLGEYYE